MSHPSLRRSLCPLLAGLSLATAAHAGSRHFTYSYETTTMPAGAMELETWATWKSQQADSPGTDTFDIRHEFEFGVTDRLQLALYFADWTYERPGNGKSGSDFSDVAVEAIYNLTDPNTTPFGSAVYGEIKGSDDFIELEAKLLLQKNFGRWIFVYNVGGEIAWENDYNDDEAELFQTFGASYQVDECWSVGAEVLHEVGVPDVEEWGSNGLFAGPNVTWRNKHITLGVSGLWQVTTLDGEPDFQLRTILSYAF